MKTFKAIVYKDNLVSEREFPKLNDMIIPREVPVCLGFNQERCIGTVTLRKYKDEIRGTFELLALDEDIIGLYPAVAAMRTEYCRLEIGKRKTAPKPYKIYSIGLSTDTNIDSRIKPIKDKK